MPTIRRATLADREALIHLRLALFRDLGELRDEAEAPTITTILAHYFDEEMPPGRFHAWLAFDDAGVAIGSGGLIFIQKPPMPSNDSGREAYLMNMYTAPSWRGRGVARAIVGAILAFAREAGISTVRLHASVPGRPVYERAGFKATDAEMVITL